MTMLLNKTCSTKRTTEGKSGFGGNTRTMAAHLSGVRCRRQQMGGEETNGLGASGYPITHRLWCDYGTDIVSSDQVVLDGVTYEVLDVDPDMASAGRFTVIMMREVR